MATKKIEVSFAIPVELTEEEMQVIDMIANDAARRTETAEIVHWAAGCGDKPNWSKTDCAIFGYEPTPDSPESGEPTFDDSIFCVETATRERYDTEPFDPKKHRPPIADLLLAINDPHRRSGVGLIREERIRQVKVEGWSAEHDDAHTLGEMARAGMCYIQCAHNQSQCVGGQMDVPLGWPWEPQWWKPSPQPERNFIKGSALIAAEIDRLRRKEKKQCQTTTSGIWRR